MKKLLAILTVSLATRGAFAQGKVSFQTDSLHLVYSPFVDYSNLVADLYMGTSSSLLYLYASTTFGTLAAGMGKWTSVSVQANANATTGAPGIPSGSVFVEVAVHTTERPPMNIYDAAALQTYEAFGSSVPFNFNLGTGITYPVLWSQTAGNWPPGTWPMDQYGTGARAAIIVTSPEPSAIALLGLGAAMFILRRKSSSRAVSDSRV
jgi:hypothetical protein